MRVALAQMDVLPGLPERNLGTMLEMIEQAKRDGADLIAFPEMSVGGYLLGDVWTQEAFVDDLMEYNEILRKASHGIAIAYGNVHAQEGLVNKDGRRRKLNAVHVFQDGKTAQRLRCVPGLPEGIQPKTLLPTYRMFDDERYFFSLQDIAKDEGYALKDLLQPFLIDMDGKRRAVGFELCEDLWCADYRKDNKPIDPTAMLIENGAELVINLSASPWTYGKNAARDRRVQEIRERTGGTFVPFLYVNCVGVQNNGKNFVTFDGGTTAYNVDAQPVAIVEEPYAQKILTIDDIILAGSPIDRPSRTKMEEKHAAIVRGIQHVKDIRGSPHQPRYVIGLSGGIDSAVVAVLLVDAVGNDKVFAINMPTKYNSAKTKDAAAQIAKNLGIGYAAVPVGELADANAALLNAADIDGTARRLSILNEENVQAKVRGAAVLSNIAAKYGALFTNNGNKLETALGYATLYGDVAGALAPIADLTKAEVFDMARYLNDCAGRMIIPGSLIPDELYRFADDQIQPTAELKEDQVDPMKFGYHCALIEAMTNYRKAAKTDIMEWYIAGTMEEHLGVSTALLDRWGLDDPKTFLDDLDWFDGLRQASVFKRVQSPPIIITSKSAYGYDLRESQLPTTPTRREQRLRAQVAKMDCYLTKGGKQ